MRNSSDVSAGVNHRVVVRSAMATILLACYCCSVFGGVGYAITGVRINDSLEYSLAPDGVLMLEPSDVIQFIGVATPSSVVNMAIEDPILRQSTYVEVQTDGNGVFYYPESYYSAALTHTLPESSGSWLFVFDCGNSYGLSSVDRSTIVSSFASEFHFVVEGLGLEVLPSEIVLNPDTLAYVRYRQEVMNGETVGEHDWAAVARGRAIFEGIAEEEFRAVYNVAYPLIIYGWEATSCCMAIAGAPPLAPHACTPLVAHVVLDISDATITHYENSGGLSPEAANQLRAWQGLGELSYAVVSFSGEGDPRKAKDVLSYLNGVFGGTATLLDGLVDDSRGSGRVVRTVWDYDGTELVLLIRPTIAGFSDLQLEASGPVPVDGSSVSLIRATVTMADDTPASDGTTVHFSANGFNGCFSDMAGVCDSDRENVDTVDGVAVTYFRPTATGAMHFSAWVDAGLSDVTTVSAVPSATDQLTVNVRHLYSDEAQATYEIKGTLHDASGNPFDPGTPVTFSSTLGLLCDPSESQGWQNPFGWHIEDGWEGSSYVHLRTTESGTAAITFSYGGQAATAVTYLHVGASPSHDIALSLDASGSKAIDVGGEFLVAAAQNHLRVFSTETWTLVNDITLEFDRIPTSVDIDDSGQLVMVALGTKIGFIDPVTGSQVWNPSMDCDHDCSLAPSLQYGATFDNGDDSVSVWYTSHGGWYRDLPTAINIPESLEFSPDGTRLLVANREYVGESRTPRLRAFRTSGSWSEDWLFTGETGRTPGAACWSPSSQHIAWCETSVERVYVLTRSGSRINEFYTDSDCYSVAWSPSSTEDSIAVQCASGVHIFDPFTGMPKYHLENSPSGDATDHDTLAWTSDGTKLAVLHGDGSDNILIYAPYDVSPPLLLITSPADGAVCFESEVAVTGSVTDDFKLDADATRVRVNGGAWSDLSLTSSGIFAFDAQLIVGVNLIEVCAADVLGHESCVSVSITRVFLDCNGNGVEDDLDLAGCDGSPWCSDCDEDGILDQCNLEDCDGSLWCSDCNANEIPDVCEDDADHDGVPDDCDECPGHDDTLDRDSDSMPDGCDNCPDAFNPEQEDADEDGVGDACEYPVSELMWVHIEDPGVPGHEGFLGSMSKHETTNAQYCRFLNAALASGDVLVDGNFVRGAAGMNPGGDFVGEPYYRLDGPGFSIEGATNGGAARITWTDGAFGVDTFFADHPVTHVSWYGATAFADYYGWRLPTEWEWQAVADSDEGSFVYGCGLTLTSTTANYRESYHPDGTTPVGDFGEYGAYAMCDMAGNAWEWTSSPYGGVHRMIRGGRWNGGGDDCKVNNRDTHYYPETAEYNVGFRVAKDPEDCNENGFWDYQDFAACDGSPWCRDCNGNGVLDECDLTDGTLTDSDGNGIPDECVGSGDMDCDSVIDMADVPLFVEALLDPAAFDAAHPGCGSVQGDLDGSGLVNGDDVQAFVEALLQGP